MYERQGLPRSLGTERRIKGLCSASQWTPSQQYWWAGFRVMLPFTGADILWRNKRPLHGNQCVSYPHVIRLRGDVHDPPQCDTSEKAGKKNQAERKASERNEGYVEASRSSFVHFVFWEIHLFLFAYSCYALNGTSVSFECELNATLKWPAWGKAVLRGCASVVGGCVRHW